MSERDRKLVSTHVAAIYLDTSIGNLINTLDRLKSEYGADATVELYTEYYGGNEGSAAVRLCKMLPESDKVYARRMAWLDEREKEQKKRDEEAYERIRAQRLADGKEP